MQPWPLGVATMAPEFSIIPLKKELAVTQQACMKPKKRWLIVHSILGVHNALRLPNSYAAL
jgi:hypothetical protein